MAAPDMAALDMVAPDMAALDMAAPDMAVLDMAAPDEAAPRTPPGGVAVRARIRLTGFWPADMAATQPATPASARRSCRTLFKRSAGGRPGRRRGGGGGGGRVASAGAPARTGAAETWEGVAGRWGGVAGSRGDGAEILTLAGRRGLAMAGTVRQGRLVATPRPLRPVSAAGSTAVPRQQGLGSSVWG